jgi:DNA-directed RNA polymerase subunit K/omega
MADNNKKDIEDVEVEEEEPEVSEDEEAEAEASEPEDDGDIAADPPEEESDVEASDTEEADPEEEDPDDDDGDEEGAAEEEDDGDEEGAAEPQTKKKSRKGKAKAVSNISGIEMLQASNAAASAIPSIEDESDEEPEEDEFYLQKFDSELRNNFILNHHPEARTHNYEEVKAMSRVSRDGKGIIVDKLHKTLPFLTKYEMTRVLGQRAKQLDSGAKAFVKVPLNVIDGYHIAKLELEEKKIPFIIKRPFPNGGVEYWNVSDLEVL